MTYKLYAIRLRPLGYKGYVVKPEYRTYNHFYGEFKHARLYSSKSVALGAATQMNMKSKAIDIVEFEVKECK